MLKSLNHELYEASSGKQCLELVETGDFDCIILDHNLLDCTSDKIIEKIRRISYCPIISLTGVGNEKLIIRLFKLGINDYVSKNDIFLFLVPAVQNAIAYKCVVDNIKLIKESYKYK